MNHFSLLTFHFSLFTSDLASHGQWLPGRDQFVTLGHLQDVGAAVLVTAAAAVGQLGGRP